MCGTEPLICGNSPSRRGSGLLGLDACVRVHRAAHEAPQFDVVENAHLIGADRPLRRGDEVHPLHADEITVARAIRSTAVATVQSHPLTLPSDHLDASSTRMPGMTFAVAVVMVSRRREPYVPWT